MPNGHGGVPFLGGPILFAVLFAVFAALPFKDRLGWTWVAICLAFAARTFILDGRRRINHWKREGRTTAVDVLIIVPSK